MKKIMVLALSAIMVMSMAACGAKPAAPAPAASTPAPSAPAASAPAEPESTGWVPTEDIEFVIPFGAGGGNDVLSRKIVEIIEKNNLCPVKIVPVNKSGGSGVVGYTYLTSKGAGYEYAIASTSASFFTQPITGNSPFDLSKDFSYVSHMVKDPCVVVCTPSLGFKNLDDVVAFAKANPGKLKWGGVGNASDDAIVMYMLNDAADIGLTYVPYDDDGLLQAAVMGGHVDLCVKSIGEAEELMKSGEMTPLAAISDVRLSALPDLSTASEQSYEIGHQQNRGVVMNAGVSEDVLKFYSDMMQKVSETDEWKAFVEGNGMTNSFLPYDEWTEYSKEVAEDYTTYLKIAGVI